MPKTRTAAFLIFILALSGCGGMTRAVHSTGQIADKYGCLAKDFKGEGSCQPDGTPAPPESTPAQ